jgi:hypothetical protein
MFLLGFAYFHEVARLSPVSGADFVAYVGALASLPADILSFLSSPGGLVVAVVILFILSSAFERWRRTRRKSPNR